MAAGIDALSKRKNDADPIGDSLKRILAQPPEVAMVKLAIGSLTSRRRPRSGRPEDRGLPAESEAILRELGAASPFLTRRFEERLATYPR